MITSNTMNQDSELLQEDSHIIDEESQVGTINASWNFHYAMAQPWQRRLCPRGVRKPKADIQFQFYFPSFNEVKRAARAVS